MVLEDSGKRTLQGRIIYTCLCDCGKKCKVSSACLVNGDTISCGCLRQSKGEYLIEQFLKNHNISYIKEYTFKDLVSKKNGKLRFDFAIFKENQIKYLIEFDGKQHFEATDSYRFNTEYLKEIKEHDALKNNYCKNNQLHLIRIKYNEINHIPDILKFII